MASPLLDGTSPEFLALLETCPVVPDAIVSKPLLNRPEGRVVVFSMDAGQQISEHRAPFLASVQVLEGRLRFEIGGGEREMSAHDWLLMPPDAPHSLRALEPTRFLLTLFARHENR